MSSRETYASSGISTEKDSLTPFVFCPEEHISYIDDKDTFEFASEMQIFLRDTEKEIGKPLFPLKRGEALGVINDFLAETYGNEFDLRFQRKTSSLIEGLRERGYFSFTQPKIGARSIVDEQNFWRAVLAIPILKSIEEERSVKNYSNIDKELRERLGLELYSGLYKDRIQLASERKKTGNGNNLDEGSIRNETTSSKRKIPYFRKEQLRYLDEWDAKRLEKVSDMVQDEGLTFGNTREVNGMVEFDLQVAMKFIKYSIQHANDLSDFDPYVEIKKKINIDALSRDLQQISQVLRMLNETYPRERGYTVKDLFELLAKQASERKFLKIKQNPLQ